MNIDKKKKNIIRIAILVVAVIAICVSVYFLFFNKTEEEEKDTVAISPTCIDNVIESENYDAYRELFDSYKAINPDVKAILYSPSTLCQDQVIVQSSLDYPDSSLEYLNKNWKTGGYSKWGTVFIDGRNVINQNGTCDDQNLIIYGHSFTGNINKDLEYYFTYFADLMDQSNYEANKYFVMVYENEAIVYEVATVYTTYLDSSGSSEYNTPSSSTLPYYYTNYTSEMFQNYVKLIKEVQCYDTGVELTESDKLLTFSTCTKNDIAGDRLIVLCKEVKTINIR